MKHILIIVVAFSALFPSCKSPESIHKFEKSKIVMKKTECYGTCPVYQITLLGTGKAMYEGIRHVERIGKFEKQLSPQETLKIFNAFEASNFTDFKEIYTEPISDLSTTFITFVHRGFSKTIEDYYNAPPELKKLEKMVEEVANSDGWTEVRN